MRQSDGPFSSPTSLGALSDDLQQIIAEVDAAAGPAPFAAVDHTPDGPRLIVGGNYVRWWMGPAHAPEAEAMAAQINTAFAARIAGALHHST